MSDETTTPRPLRWGILATGEISNDFVLALNYSQSPHKVVAVAASSSLEKAKEFCNRFALEDAQAYGSYPELLQDPNIDVVYVANLNGGHLEWAMKALSAGKQVLCEKAIAVNAKQAIEVIRCGREKKLFLMEGFWSRFFPSYRKLREIIDSGELGAPKFAEAHMGFELQPSRRNLSAGECPLLDIGGYAIQFALFVFPGQKVTKIDCSGQLDENGVDLWANITLHFENGAHAICYYNSVTKSSSMASVAFEKGEIVFPERCWSATKLWKLTPGEKPGPEVFEFPLPDELPGVKRVEGCSFNFPNSAGLAYEADHVYECINRGETESSVIGLDESLLIMEILDKVRGLLGVRMPHDEDQ